MTRNSLTSLMLAVALGATAGNPWLACDFSEGIPAEFILWDLDGNEPSRDVTQYGFAVGTPWVALEVDGGMVAASTSWYQTPGTSDDWLVTPAFTVESADGVLSWRARAADASYADGYAVYIAPASPSLPEDMKQIGPALEVKAEAATWTSRSLSLADYAGQTVCVAFVNNSTDKSRLYIDDIEAGIPTALKVVAATASLINHDGAVDIAVTVVCRQDSDSFTVGLDIGTVSLTREIAQSLTSGESLDVIFESAFAIDADETVGYAVWVEDSDGVRYEVATEVTSYPQRTLLEEFTGTWCGYCVRGIVFIEQMKEQYGDAFIPVAVHCTDVMSVTDSYPTIGVASGLPCCTTNRDAGTSTDPRNMEGQFLNSQSRPLVASIALDAEVVDGVIEAVATIRPATDIADSPYRLGFILAEDGVYHPGDSDYWQHNSYAGGLSGVMGGFEALDEYVQDFTFNDVARAQWGDKEGIEGSLPTTLSAREAVTYSTTLDIPARIDDIANCRLVAILIDSTTGIVANAVATPLAATDASLQGRRASSSPDSPVAVDWYDLYGRRLSAPRGLCLKVERLSDGIIITTKTVIIE